MTRTLLTEELKATAVEEDSKRRIGPFGGAGEPPLMRLKTAKMETIPVMNGGRMAELSQKSKLLLGK